MFIEWTFKASIINIFINELKRLLFYQISITLVYIGNTLKWNSSAAKISTHFVCSFHQVEAKKKTIILGLKKI